MSGANISGSAGDLASLLTLLASPDQTRQRVEQLKKQQETCEAACAQALAETTKLAAAQQQLKRDTQALDQGNAELRRQRAQFDLERNRARDEMQSRELGVQQREQVVTDQQRQMSIRHASSRDELAQRERVVAQAEQTIAAREAAVAAREDRIHRRKIKLEAALAEEA